MPSFVKPKLSPRAITLPTRITFMVFIISGLESGMPAHITTLSAILIAPLSRTRFTAFWIMVSELSATLHKTGEMPHWIISWRQTFCLGVTAMTICSGRKLPMILAVFPCSVGTRIAFAPRFLANLYALWATVWPISMPGLYSASRTFIRLTYSWEFSVVWVIRAIIFTDSTGYLPLAVSPLSITASVPSKTAFETSVNSALVGRGLTIIESSIWVAVITGLPAERHTWIIAFWARGIRSVGNWTPKSPRAIMIPSASFTISFILLTPSSFSIFAMTRAEELSSFRYDFISTTSSGKLTKLAATKSMSISVPNFKSSLSFCDMIGRPAWMPIRFTFLRLPIVPELAAVQSIVLPETSFTSSSISPSAMRTFTPGKSFSGASCQERLIWQILLSDFAVQ